MNKTLIKGLGWLFPLLFIVLLCFRIVLREKEYTDYALLFVLGCIGGYFILFKKELFYSMAIFLIPLSVNTSIISGSNLSAPSELMISCLALVAIFIGLIRPTYFKKILFHPLSFLLLIDLCWMIIASFYSDMSLYSFKRVLARFLFLIVFYLFTAHWVIKPENLIKFFLLYSLGLIIPIFVTEYHHSFYNFNPRTVYELCKPFYNDHTIYGASIAYLLPFMLILSIKARSFGFSKKNSIGLWVLFSVFVVAEILAFSRAAWLSIGVSLLMFVFLKLRLKFWHFILGLSTLIVLFIHFKDPLYERARRNENVSNKGEIGEHLMSVSNLNSDASNLERINRWSSAIRMYEDRPITGFGPGTYQYVYGPYQSVYEMTYISTMAGDRGNAHSEPLTYLSETGLPGFISYLIWSLATFAFGIRAYHKSKNVIVKNMVLAALLGFTTFFFHGMVNSFIDQVKVASLVFGSMAMIVVADVAGKINPSTYEKEEGH